MLLKGKFAKLLYIVAAATLFILFTGTGINFTGSPPGAAEAYTGPDRYTVRAGDTLFAIAGKYGVSVPDLKSASGIRSDNIYPGQVLKVPAAGGGAAKPLWSVLKEKGITSPGRGMKIVIDKSDHTLSLLYGSTWLKSYHVELGEGGLGDKQVAGDRKTPEGTFYVCEKSVLSPPDYYLGSRWMRISYPNSEDAGRGLRQGLISQWTYNSIVSAVSAGKTPPQNTALGGGIGIHGGDGPWQGESWTWGCIGLSSSDVEDFFDYVGVGTPVTIQK